MKRRNSKGFTLVEVTIILLVLVVLGAILLPMAERFVDLARIARVREDIGAIAAVIELWKYDNCTRWFHVDGDDSSFTSNNRVDLLVGDGDIAATSFVPLSTDDYWSKTFGLVNFVDTIASQLAAGDPFAIGVNGSTLNTDNTAATSPYPIPSSTSVFACGFRGAYISTPISPDPWGNRYMVNVAWMGARGTRDYGTPSQIVFSQFDTFVLSAGPDETVDTEFQVGTPLAPVGVVAQGDDQIAVINGGF